ncbi:MAG: terminase TerL endonuclease subunit [Oscillospiraceae bacterium]
MSDITESRAYKYALWASDENNRAVGKYVRRQCAEWLDIANGENSAAFVDLKEYDQTMALLGLMIHPDLHTPMPEALEDYALLFITALFCTKTPDGRNYYTDGLLEIARKNFKTFTSGVIFVLAMLKLPKFSRLFSVAPDLKLSSELKVAIRKIIKSSPLLEPYFKVMRLEVKCSVTDTEYTPLAYSNDKLDGKLAHLFLADEVGGMDSYPVEAMRSSQVVLRDKLGILISTQYPNDSNGLTDEIDLAKKQLDGVYDGKRKYFALLFEPDEEIKNNWEKDDNVLLQANPVAVNNADLLDTLRDMRTLAVLYEGKRENFLCKHCNIQYKGIGTEGYIDLMKVQECAVTEDVGFWRGRDVYLGLDLSLTNDNTSVAMVTLDEKGKIHAKVWGFLPADNVEIKSAKEKVDYRRHIAAGECFSCGGEVIDYGFVERFILDLPKKYGVNIVQLGYDRYNALSTVQKLEADEDNPIECVEIKQHSSVLHAPTKLLKEYVLRREFAYDENKLLEINFSNARCTEDTNLNKYVNKKRSAGKVDMVVSLINAVFLLQLEMLEGECDFSVQY